MNAKQEVSPATVILFDQYTVPSLRMVGGFGVGKHLGIFAGGSFDFHFPGMPTENGLTEGFRLIEVGTSDGYKFYIAPKFIAGLRL